MAATDPITPDPRRFSIRLRWPLLIGVVAAVMSLKSAVAGNLADEESGANAPLPDQAVTRRSADEIVEEIETRLKLSRRSLQFEEFKTTHHQIAALVEELRNVYPDDPRIVKFLPERWQSLACLRRQDQLHLEIDEILRTTTDSVIKRDALFYRTLLRFQKPIDGPDAASLAESFARAYPDDNRSAGVLYGAAEKMNGAMHVRMILVLFLGAPVALTAFSARGRALLRRRWWILTLLVALPALLTVVAVTRAPGLLLHAKDVVAVAPLLFHEGSAILWDFLSSQRAGIFVALASAAALIFVIFRRRVTATSLQWTAIVRLGFQGFTAALAICCAVDAALIAGKKAALIGRIAREYPDSFSGRMVQGQSRQRERIGTPFELEFRDAISGLPVSMKDFRGKVVVVDFWATWCGPCVREIPEMKQLYSKYHDQGVEFIGVSHDLPEEDGGLESLRAFVSKEKIPWPQYYEARNHRAILTGSALSDFSESWGIDGIPTVFLIDAEGKLYSTEARGRLDTLIPRLLKSSKAPSP